jgi:hypothetical integral membrane protein (TIGR02206 family)
LNPLLAPDRMLPLLVIAITVAALLAVSRGRPTAWLRRTGRMLAVLTLGAEVSWWGSAVVAGTWTARYHLPLHLCEAGAFVLAAALWSARPLLVEISYFWGLGGATAALITPDIPVRFPHFVYFQYYVEHGLIVLGALYLVTALGHRPRRGAVIRVFLLTAAYTAIVGVADYITGGNYMFLRHIPATGTLLDDLGPWPWYILTCGVIALIVFGLLYVPFAQRRSVPATPAEAT